MASLFACLIFMSSIVKLSTIQTQKQILSSQNRFISLEKISSLLLADIALEFFSQKTSLFFSFSSRLDKKQKLQATTGPAQQPLQASSIQIIIQKILLYQII